MTTGGDHAVVRGFPSVVLRDTRFTSLVARGTSGPQYLDVVRGSSARVGRVDVDLRGGRDSFTVVGAVTGRVDLGSGDRDSYSPVRSAEKVFSSSFRRAVLEGDERDNELVAPGRPDVLLGGSGS